MTAQGDGGRRFDLRAGYNPIAGVKKLQNAVGARIVNDVQANESCGDLFELHFLVYAYRDGEVSKLFFELNADADKSKTIISYGLELRRRLRSAPTRTGQILESR
ncbi:hypothetical protein SAMN06296378_2936 [Salinibacterium xinjiangense]|uniref:Uncharacterized protein n=1 Tax=Salinibacterium xinjiangense TaxID=386302 RepID=A0A2C9A3R1_9MICO|nr:hypothetical protein SAMN06296378_2936 [Salinibacterium xinjiangense]